MSLGFLSMKDTSCDRSWTKNFKFVSCWSPSCICFVSVGQTQLLWDLFIFKGNCFHLFFFLEVTVVYQNGLPVISVNLPSRRERCQFTLKPISDSVGVFLQQLQAEDRGIDRVAIYSAGTVYKLIDLLDRYFYLAFSFLSKSLIRCEFSDIPQKVEMSLLE